MKFHLVWKLNKELFEQGKPENCWLNYYANSTIMIMPLTVCLLFKVYFTKIGPQGKSSCWDPPNFTYRTCCEPERRMKILEKQQNLQISTSDKGKGGRTEL